MGQLIQAAVIPAVLAAGIACAPLAQAQPGLDQPFSEAGGPYVGEWSAHHEGLHVNPDGTGTETSNYGTVSFRMSTVQGRDSTAYGNIISGAAGRGGYVTMQLVDNGNGLLLSIAGGDNGFSFCKLVNGTRVNSADCGA